MTGARAIFPAAIVNPCPAAGAGVVDGSVEGKPGRLDFKQPVAIGPRARILSALRRVDYRLAEIPGHSHEFPGLLPKATGQPNQLCRSACHSGSLTATPEPLEVRDY